MGICNEHLHDIVIVFGAHGVASLAAAFLRAICIQGYAFDITCVGDGDDHVFARNQVFDIDIDFRIGNFCAAITGPAVADGGGFIADDLNDAFITAQNIQQIFDNRAQIDQVIMNLVAFQPGQSVQLQFQDGTRLIFGHVEHAVFVFGVRVVD